MISVLRDLGFLNEGGAPTEYYDRLRDPNEWRYVLGERIHDLYADLYSIDSAIHAASEREIKGAISRVTGKDDEAVKRYYSTFKTLAGLAKFEAKPTKAKSEEKPEQLSSEKPILPGKEEHEHKRRSEFHYNFQIHLPVTTDITVYNAIFKSLKEHLGI
jgi:hypothetical protein